MDLPTAVPMGRGAHTVTQLLVHVVWATHRRAPFLDMSCDPLVAQLLEDAARRIACAALAVGNAADHVHIVVRHPPTLAVADLVQRLKGASARSLNTVLGRTSEHAWQAGYWAESVDGSDVGALADYVRNQRAHHDLSPHPEPWEAIAP